MPDTQLIESLLQDTRAAIRVAHEELERIRSQATAAEELLTRLREEEKGLVLALKRHGGAAGEAGAGQQVFEVADEPEPEPDQSVDDEIGNLPRTDAIVKILEEHPRGLSPAEVRDALRGRGREDEYQVVSAALGHLKRQGRVSSPQRGLYIATRIREEATA